MTMKEFKEREFAKCIEVDEKKIEINVEDFIVEESYSGPKLNSIEDINSEWVVNLASYLASQKVLHKKFAYMIILKCREIFEKENSLIYINVPDDKDINVIGDVHG